MKIGLLVLIIITILILAFACEQKPNKINKSMTMTAADILGNPEYKAISYGGYRHNSRDIQPSVEELIEDMKILSAMGIKVLRTYNVHFPHAENVLKAITALKKEDQSYEMYVMLGAWINCENAFTGSPNHEAEDEVGNTAEIDKAVDLAKQYPDIVKVIAVGNEAMVQWAASYYVRPRVILKWVRHLQNLKQEGNLPKSLWITSSDNFASWGGGGVEYHVDDLEQLIRAVDFLSIHTYPMHDTHYNPEFWGIVEASNGLTKEEQISAAMRSARDYAINQYKSVADYVDSLKISKPIHIGETGWASSSDGLYGNEGSKATDEFKEGLYYKLMREWTSNEEIACFYFEAFDESWKDAGNPAGSENYFGLFTIEGRAKYALWDLVDSGAFLGLSRGGGEILKTHGGDLQKLLQGVLLPDPLTIESY